MLIIIALFEGCIDQNSNTQTQVIGTNGTTIIDSSNDISLQKGEKIHYVNGYYNNPDSIGSSIAAFTETHNVTRIVRQYQNDYVVGAYLIYTE